MQRDLPRTSPDLTAMSAVAMAAAVREGRVSPVELVEASLARIAEVQPVLNPFAFVWEEEARAAAEKAEAAVARGETLGPLHGVPVAFKDFTPTAGQRTTRGSHCFSYWVPEEDPVIVRRFRAAGALIVGKTTTPEFAFTGTTASRLFGHTRNPWDRTRTSGGSSGGSAVAVATGCVALAEGTDMGGSVRIPAALCGLVGLKPSLGRIPMDILPTVFDNISHFGPLARTVEDAALFLKVAEGPDEADIQSQLSPLPLPETLGGDVAGLRIALSEDLGFYQVDGEVRDNLHAVADALREAGAVVEPVPLGWTSEIAAGWHLYWRVALQAAFGDCLYKFRDRMDPDLVAIMEQARRDDALSLRRFEHVRTRQWQSLARLFASYDALLCPTCSRGAPRIDDVVSEPETALARDTDDEGLSLTMPFNCVAQCPVISVPSGMTGEGLPTAVQIVARRFDDPAALRIARAVERMRPWPAWAPGRLSGWRG